MVLGGVAADAAAIPVPALAVSVVVGVVESGELVLADPVESGALAVVALETPVSPGEGDESAGAATAESEGMRELSPSILLALSALSDAAGLGF